MTDWRTWFDVPIQTVKVVDVDPSLKKKKERNRLLKAQRKLVGKMETDLIIEKFFDCDSTPIESRQSDLKRLKTIQDKLAKLKP